ncbi:MAG TPA: hypothetical protein VLL98_03175 [Rickettsiales bacterium]|nr:hypothetical protein [Rickettsiales bacterium]
MSRNGRQYPDIRESPRYSENQIVQLPLNENIVCFKSDDHSRILSRGILKIDDKSYHNLGVKKMKKQIIIATINESKFEVVKSLLLKCGFDYIFENINHLQTTRRIKEEIGTVDERAKQKADFFFEVLKETEELEKYHCIIGIDDAIELKGKTETEVKKFIKPIVEGNFLAEGENVFIVRSFYFKTADKEYGVLTKIPFIYKKYDKEVDFLLEKTYPLSYVLCPTDSKIPVMEIKKQEADTYNLSFCKDQLEKARCYLFQKQKEL